MFYNACIYLSGLFWRLSFITLRASCVYDVFPVIFVTGPGRGLLGSPVEDPAEPVSACCPSSGCCWIPGKFPGPSQVHPVEVSLPDTCLRTQMQQVQVFNGFFSHPVSMVIPIALCGPAWIYWAPGSISTSTARTAVGNKFAVTSACTGPSTLPARLSSTRSSSDTEHCWRPTWRKVE